MDRQALRPPFAYYGGKTTLAPQIADLLPAHEHYVEPFAGSLAVLLAKRPSKAETVNDLDGDLMTFWRVLRDEPTSLARLAMLTPHSRAELAVAKDLTAVDDLERARRVWVQLTQSRAQSMKVSGWKYMQNPAGRSMTTVRNLMSFAERMEAAASRLRTVSLECRDALDVIRDYGAHESSCLYVDPPYLGSTRATNYRHELTTDEDHRALADALGDCKGSVVLSGYNAPLYADLFVGWHRMEIKAPPTLSGDVGRVEVLWSNRPIGEPDLFGGVA